MPRTNPRNKYLTGIGFLLCLCLVTAQPVLAQEDAEAILERGYIAHWFACGPFPSDLPEGIVNAVSLGELPLGQVDYMEPLGGINQVLPQHRIAVNYEGGAALWQRAGSSDPTLDLNPFFSSSDEGVAYAAFFTTSKKRQLVMLDIQSPLGVRFWINRVPARDVVLGPLSAVGRQQVIVALREGRNLVIMEVPGASYNALANAAGISERELNSRVFKNRPLLQGKSGFEIALEIHPVAPIEEVYYTTRLIPTGNFTGQERDIRQDMTLSLFNPFKKPSKPIAVAVQIEDMLKPIIEQVTPIAPVTQKEIILPVSTLGRAMGETVAVTVYLTEGDTTKTFIHTMTVADHNKDGAMYLLTGIYPESAQGANEIARYAARNQSLSRQLEFYNQEAKYGPFLGTVNWWRPYLYEHGEDRLVLNNGVSLGQLGVSAAYAPIDERMVGGEFIARNIALGVLSAEAELSDLRPAYVAWDTPAMAPQTPQLLRSAGVSGIVSNQMATGLPPLFRHSALDRSRMMHRRKAPAPGLTTESELTHVLAKQRSELAIMGIPKDLMVMQNVIDAPEPFWQDRTEAMSQALPAILIEGDGAADFFDYVSELAPELQIAIPDVGQVMTTTWPGDLLTHPDLKQAHSTLQSRMLATEMAATFAALQGAEYPEAEMDFALRNLLYWAQPAYLSHVDTMEDYADALAGLRELSHVLGLVQEKSLAYMATHADTLSRAPLDTAGVVPVLVFNPTGRKRTSVYRVPVEGATPVHVETLSGESVGSQVLWEGRRQGERILEFMAEDVPAMGYATYYITPGDGRLSPDQRTDVQIENDSYVLIADAATGDIISLRDKETDAEWAPGALNQVVYLPEDNANVDGGREVWSTGTKQVMDTRPIVAQSLIAPGVQRLRFIQEWKGTQVIREVTLRDGMPQVECSLEVEHSIYSNGILGLSHQVDSTNHVPVFGERYGSVAGRKSREDFVFQSKQIDNPSGHGAQPAWQWFASGQGDHIRIGRDGALNFGPLAIVYGEDPELKRVSKTLRHAFQGRGIPAALWPSSLERKPGLWSDSTELPTYDADLNHGSALRIVIGLPEQNPLVDQILKHQDASVREIYSERLAKGAVILVSDTNVPVEHKPVPTVLVGALTTARIVELVESMATAVRKLGIYTLPESAYLAGAIPKRPDRGMALLFDGSQWCSLERDGALFQGLAHGGAKLNPEPGKVRFDYALRPFTEDWRTARIPEIAHAQALPSLWSKTDLHSGAYPGALSFVEADAPGWIITSVKPAGYPMAERQSIPHPPRDGFIIRGYEPYGQSGSATLNTFLGLRNATSSTLREASGLIIPFQNDRVNFEIDGFEVATLWAVPATNYEAQDPVDLGLGNYAYGSIPTRYWAGQGGPAVRGMQPLGLRLNGEFTEELTTVEVVLTNHLQDDSLEGMLHLEAPEGWSIGPSESYYNLEPGEYLRRIVNMIPVSAKPDTAAVIAWADLGGEIYRDVRVLQEDTLSMTITRTQSQLKVRVDNAAQIQAEGVLDIVLSPRNWRELVPEARLTVSPHRKAVVVPASSYTEYKFTLSDPEAPYSLVVKLSANNEVHYEQVAL